jgi:adenylate cyclase
VKRTRFRRLYHLIRELKHRRVYRTAAIYAAAAFVVLQAADLLIEGLSLPPWVLSLLIILALLGLPVAAILAWLFDLTPPGIHRAGTDPGTTIVVGSRTRLVLGGALLILAGGLGFAAYARIGTDPAGPPPSIAVLPFEDLGGDPDDEYLRDGLTEDVLTQLAKASGLHVISRTSIMQYKESPKGIRTIADELGATHVLEGSVRRTGDRLRITAQLIDARTDRHVWAESYDRTQSDIFEIQSDIAQRIARALQVRLTPQERKRMDAVATTEPMAYDLYLRARQHLYRYDREANEVAIELARKALALDPELAPAHALLGTAFAFKVRVGDGPVWGDSAMIAAQRAITLDPELAEGHLALGNAYLRLGRYPEALRSYARAAALNPSDWRAASNSAVVYSYQGQLVEALRWTRRAIDMAPRSPLIGMAYQNLTGYYIDLGLPDRAAESLERARELQPSGHPQISMLAIGVALYRQDHAAARALADTLSASAPTDPSAQLVAGDGYLFSGDLAAARVHYQRAYVLSPPAEGIRHYAQVLLGWVLWQQGEPERAERLFTEFEALASDELAQGHDNYTVFLSLAAVAATRGDSEAALLHLERAIGSGGVATEWSIQHDPLLAPLRTHPRYSALRSELARRGELLRGQVLREDL